MLIITPIMYDLICSIPSQILVTYFRKYNEYQIKIDINNDSKNHLPYYNSHQVPVTELILPLRMIWSHPVLSLCFKATQFHHGVSLEYAIKTALILLAIFLQYKKRNECQVRRKNSHPGEPVLERSIKLEKI